MATTRTWNNQCGSRLQCSRSHWPRSGTQGGRSSICIHIFCLYNFLTSFCFGNNSNFFLQYIIFSTQLIMYTRHQFILQHTAHPILYKTASPIPYTKHIHIKPNTGVYIKFEIFASPPFFGVIFFPQLKCIIRSGCSPQLQVNIFQPFFMYVLFFSLF